MVALFAIVAGVVHAAQLYDVIVTSDSQNAAFEDAMRIALQRATGRLDAGADPALTDLIAQPRRYVKVVGPAAGGGTQILFDGPAIERAIAAAGRSVWGAVRPRTVIALRAPAIDDSVKTQLEAAAELRGVPIAVTTAAALGLPDGSVTQDEALSAAQRSGGDALLLGERAGELWRWSLFTRTSTAQTAGAVASGLNDAVDLYVRAAAAVQTLPEAETLVEFQGVRNLREFAQVTESLAGTPGVERILLRQVTPTAALFRLVARGGVDTLLASIGQDSRFETVNTAGGSAAALTFLVRH